MGLQCVTMSFFGTWDFDVTLQSKSSQLSKLLVMCEHPLSRAFHVLNSNKLCNLPSASLKEQCQHLLQNICHSGPCGKINP